MQENLTPNDVSNQSRKNQQSGEQLRDEAAELLKEHRGHLIRQWQRKILLLLLNERATVHSDEMHSHCPVPDGVNANFAGIAFRGLGEAKIIAKTGKSVKTRRPSAHARDIPLWELIDRSKALAWLAANPEKQPPSPIAAPLAQQSFLPVGGLGVGV